jgi:hypothetical protein
MHKLSSSQFQGFRFPNTTPVPDELFDELLADLSGAEVKVVLYICRRTFGFKKESDNISINQMLNGITKKDGTQLDRGLGLSKPTLLRTLKELAKKNIITAEQRDSVERGHEPTNYRLNILDPLGKKMTLGEYQNFTKPLVKKSIPQDTVIQETVLNTVNGNNKTGLDTLPDLDQPKDRREYVAQFILKTLGDKQSYPFYLLVAVKVPEKEIRQALSEIKTDGAKHPAKVFTHRMKLYALHHQKQM